MREPEYKGMTAAPKSPPCGSCIAGVISRAELLITRVRPRSLREEMGECTGRAWRGMGPGTYTRTMEITSGRAIFQQGLAATCKDPPTEAKAGGGGRNLVRRMSQYER